MSSEAEGVAIPNEVANETVPIPDGMRHAYRFNFLNAISFQIATGTPAVLYAKSLGASATVLGVVASMLPLLAVFQLPAANFIPKFGYKKFMLGGWGLRTTMVFALAAIPALLFADATTKLCLVLASLFIYALLRGISAGCWMPWITAVVPEESRGVYLSREQLAIHAGSLAALGVSAATLEWTPHPWRFSAIFLLSAVAGLVSLRSIQQVPDAEATAAVRSSSQPVPWLTILNYPPFRRLVLFNLLWVLVAGALPLFSVAFSREVPKLAESHILALSLGGFLGAIVTLPLTARFLDRTGSKIVLRLVTFLAALAALGWAAMAAGFVPGSAWVVALLNFSFGVASANFAVANAHLSMATMPVMGRNHFFALYTVITSLATGLSPVLWGIIIDAMHGTQRHFFGAELNYYSVYFGISAAIMATTFLAVNMLREARPAEMTQRDYAILGQIKRLARIWQR
ncbi:MAG TPA: MFS transporter [Chthoniobacterales bacterium]